MAKTDLRGQILRAAVTLFGRTHNTRKVSIEDIAAEARVSPTTIYNYFGSREALVVATARQLIGQIMQMAADVLHADLPFQQKFRLMLSGKIRMVSQYPSEVLTRMLTQDIAAARAGRAILDAEVRQLWLEFVESGKKAGYIDPALDDADVITLFDIIQAGLATRPQLLEDYRDDTSKGEKLIQLICFGFLKKDVDLFPAERPATASKGETV